MRDECERASRKPRQQLITTSYRFELQNINVAAAATVSFSMTSSLTIQAPASTSPSWAPTAAENQLLILTITCQIYPIVMGGMRVRIFGRDRWDLTQLRRHFGVVVGTGPCPASAPPSPPALTPS